MLGGTTNAVQVIVCVQKYWLDTREKDNLHSHPLQKLVRARVTLHMASHCQSEALSAVQITIDLFYHTQLLAISLK